jgi:hypothetical protein
VNLSYESLIELLCGTSTSDRFVDMTATPTEAYLALLAVWLSYLGVTCVKRSSAYCVKQD